MFSHLSIRARLLLMLLFPLLGLVFFSASNGVANYRQVQQATHLGALLEVSVATSGLIHELQRSGDCRRASSAPRVLSLLRN